MIDKAYHTTNVDLFRWMHSNGIFFDLCYADMMFDEKSKPELDWIKQVRKCAGEYSTIYIHTDQRSVCEVREAMLDAGWHLKSWIIWSYNWGGRSPRLWGAKHDDILMATKHKTKWTFNAKEVSIPKTTLINSKKDWQIPTDVWNDIGIVHTMSKEKDEGQHRVWQKPEQLMERIIKASSDAGDLVLDPFIGTGTTLKVAKKLGRSYIGCDIDEHAVEIAKSRLELV